MQSIARLFREARRRKVFRTAALYVFGAWAMLQVADVLFPGFGIPESAIKTLFWVAVLGFPVALVFGWLFDVGAGGIRRTPPLLTGESLPPQPLARRDYVLLAAFAAVAAILAFRAVQGVREAPAQTGAATSASVSKDVARLPNSIAVLPFANLSSDSENEYFCDGISEEILNEISTARQLNVIGRTSSFAFKGSNTSIEQISALLGVQYLVQGSVRKADKRLRISAQLLDEHGRQVWTQSFDRELANVFEIQEEIAQAVAERVTREVVSRPEMARRPNLEAYDHYLAGRELLHQRDGTRAMTELERAIELDPDFAEAHAEWAIARLMGDAVSGQELNEAAKEIDRALELKPHLPRAQAARGLSLLRSSPVAAESALRAALAQDPNMVDALNWLASALGAQGRNDESLRILESAYRIDPLHPAIVGNLSAAFFDRGDDEAALRLLERQLQQPSPSYASFVPLRDAYRTLGRLVDLHSIAKDIVLRSDAQYFSLALSYALLGDFPAADRWIERSTRDHPDWPFAPFSGSVVANWRGDWELARVRFERGLTAAGLDVKDQSQFVRTWYGALLARSGQYGAAIALLEPLAAVDITPESLNSGVAPEFDGWHALAWSYAHIGANEKAARILSELMEQCRLQVDTAQHPAHSDLLYYCAETALMTGDVEATLSLLDRSIKAGWRDYYVRMHDPYWSSLEKDPRYLALMATVSADVDRQRAVAERMDVEEDFLAKFEAKMAAQRASAE